MILLKKTASRARFPIANGAAAQITTGFRKPIFIIAAPFLTIVRRFVELSRW